MAQVDLPKTPIYDPKSKILRFRHEEDFETIRLNLKGTGSVFTDTRFSYFMDEYKDWKRPKEFCANPKFIDGKPHRYDALQGDLDDCWFICALEAITLNDKLIRHVVPPDQDFGSNYIGAFHFRIWQLGFWYDVVVDDRLPVDKYTSYICYAHSRAGDIFWAALLEKAYAKVCGMNTEISFGGLAHGKTVTAFQDLSGGIVELYQVYDKPSPELQRIMNEVYSKNAFMVGICHEYKQGLQENHTYTLTSLYRTDRKDWDKRGLFLIRLMNPWGHTEWEGDWSDRDYYSWRQLDHDIRKKLNIEIRDDGEFWIDELDLAKHFSYFYICHIGPGQYLSRIDGTSISTWRTSYFSGEWIYNVSAGGSALETRHENPQYRILLDWPQSDVNKDGDCNVVIELIQRSKYWRSLKPKIKFYIYALSIAEDIPVPLDRTFFEKNEPLNKEPDFSVPLGRSYIISMKLFCPGKYCIIPCTQYRNVELNFLLRVFSESRVDSWEYDTNISKCPPTEENSVQDFDERLKILFDDVAQGQEEIDSIGLMEILQAKMNVRRPLSQIIFSFITFIGNIFENIFTRRSSNDYGDSDVMFSKDECRKMIAMVDDNHSGKIGFSEFIKLWNKICFWTRVYDKQKDEKEGCVKISHLREALSSIGYDVNKRTINSLSYVYTNENKKISLTDFILCGVHLDTVLTLHEKKYGPVGNKITFTLEEWVKNTLIL